MKKTIAILVMCCIVLLFSSCQKIYSEEGFVGKYEDYIPNFSYELTQEKYRLDSDGNLVIRKGKPVMRSREYLFSNGEFSFAVENVLEMETQLEITRNYIYDDYFWELFRYRGAELEEIIQKYNCRHIELEYAEDIPIREIMENRDGYDFFWLDEDSIYTGHTVELEFIIDEYTDIAGVFSLLREVYALCDGYIYEDGNGESLFDNILDFEIWYLAPDTVFDEDIGHIHWVAEEIFIEDLVFDKEKLFIKDNNDKYSIDFDEYLTLTQHTYLRMVQEGEIHEDVDYSYLPPDEITSLFINRVEFVTKQDEIEFIYNPLDKNYYIALCYGYTPPDEKTVYLQEKIIGRYHDNTEYIIHGDPLLQDHYTEYKIGDNIYKIVRDKREGSLTFYRNGEKLDIENYRYIGKLSSGSSYYRYISLDDFADLMEMKVTHIDIIKGIVYMETMEQE